MKQMKNSLSKELESFSKNLEESSENFRTIKYNGQIKKSLIGLISRIEMAEERISELEGRTIEITWQRADLKEKEMNKINSFWDL